MPMLTKICPYCGKIIRQGENHTCRHKAYNKTRSKDETGFYSSLAWTRLREYVKARAMGADEYIYKTTGRIVPGSIAHHIIPARENPEKRKKAGHDTQ